MSLDALADRNGYVRDAAQYPLDKLLEQLRAESLATGLLPALIGYLSGNTAKWQGSVGAFAMIENMAKKATKEDDDGLILREAMGKRLEALIPHVEAGMLEELKKYPHSERIFSWPFLAQAAKAGCQRCGMSIIESHDFLLLALEPDTETAVTAHLTKSDQAGTAVDISAVTKDSHFDASCDRPLVLTAEQRGAIVVKAVTLVSTEIIGTTECRLEIERNLLSSGMKGCFVARAECKRPHPVDKRDIVCGLSL